MYNKILVPLDQSRRAEAILPHVENLAVLHGSRVIFMVVAEPPRAAVASSSRLPAIYQASVEAQDQEIEDYLAGIQGKFRGKGIASETRLAHGPIVEEIIRAANTENVDLIAIASHGRGGLARVFYGSVAAGILQRIDRPLLIIRARDGQ